MFMQWNVALLSAIVSLTGCKNLPVDSHKQYSHFIGLTDFTTFAHTENELGETVWLSPEIKARAPWNQLVLSWNVSAPPGTFLKVEACALSTNHATKFFSLGTWSPDDVTPRSSVTNQADADGDVRADTLAIIQPADAVQIRLTFGGTNTAAIDLKFLGISFCNTLVKPTALPPNRAAWGKELPVIERSQQSYPGGNGWCSPTSLSMVLNYWATKEAKPEWNVDAPEVAAGVSDHGFKFLTGNWTFNTACAGTLPGLRAYVTRFSDLSEIEDFIAAGIPVIISARYDLLQDGRADDFSGHLTVCRGFTKDGDLIINDPWTDLKVESVRHIYKRENVRRAWATSRNTVYLVVPTGHKIPQNYLGHW
ncbi:MAG: hypothetical protein RLY20_1871 [Verrucomicrobiota bacterium]|jgi:hypothetical protein